MYLPVQLSQSQIIIYNRIVLAILQVKQKEYFWNRPESCPCCGNRTLWGHGYVYRYFHDFPEALPLKRYRCPNCGAVHTIRPDEYSEGFSYTIDIQYASILGKLEHRPWQRSVSRQIQQYWYKGFRRQRVRIGLHQAPIPFLNTARDTGFPLASHSLKHSVKFLNLDSPHLIFAATDHSHPP